MTRYILAAVNNKSYSSLALVDDINVPNADKILLPAKIDKCAEQLTGAISAIKPEVVMMFWQKPLPGEICIEIMASATEVYKTNYDYNDLVDYLKSKDYATKISSSPGNSFSNGVYAKVLEYITKNDLSTRFLLIDIPVLISRSELKSLAFALEQFLKRDLESEK